MLQSSFLSLRRRLKYRELIPRPEPVLRMGKTCVAALWDCGCASVGADFDVMTFIPCSATHDQLMDDIPQEA
jgi:hypothetical protein